VFARVVHVTAVAVLRFLRLARLCAARVACLQHVLKQELLLLCHGMFALLHCPLLGAEQRAQSAMLLVFVDIDRLCTHIAQRVQCMLWVCQRQVRDKTRKRRSQHVRAAMQCRVAKQATGIVLLGHYASCTCCLLTMGVIWVAD
jgi:hypothetical protein